LVTFSIVSTNWPALACFRARSSQQKAKDHGRVPLVAALQATFSTDALQGKVCVYMWNYYQA